jgi:hypothetical protein
MDSNNVPYAETEWLHLHASAPELFSDLVHLGLDQYLPFFLIHDNANIIAAIAFLLIDLTDFDDTADLIAVHAVADANALIASHCGLFHSEGILPKGN